MPSAGLAPPAGDVDALAWLSAAFWCAKFQGNGGERWPSRCAHGMPDPYDTAKLPPSRPAA